MGTALEQVMEEQNRTNKLANEIMDRTVPISKQSMHKTSLLDNSLFSKELAPHYMELAQKLASSSLVPKSFQGKPQDLFICWEMAHQIGLSLAQGMQSIAIINGRACMWGDDMLALCMAHKDFEDIQEHRLLTDDGKIYGYGCTIKRKGRSDTYNEFTYDMAKQAGLLGKQGTWTQYPERMLKLRARGFSLRDSFTDALRGIKSREEVEDYIDADYKVSDNNMVQLPTRTEQLKNDFLTKTGNVENETMDVQDSNQKTGKETEESLQSGELASVGEEEIGLCAQIERLLHEKSITDERLNKAMVYYEVESIADLTEVQAKDFIAQLIKI